MTTPIADAYARRGQLSSAPLPPGLSPAPDARDALRLQQQRLAVPDRRSSVSIKPGDDPFASSSDLLGSSSQPLGGEEWRISEEGSVLSAVSGEAENGGTGSSGGKGKGGGGGGGAKKVVEKRGSFMKGLLGSSRRSRSSTSLSTSSISGPILLDPPRLGPISTSASLVDLREHRNSITSNSITSAPSSVRVTSPTFPSRPAVPREPSASTTSTRPPAEAPDNSAAPVRRATAETGLPQFGGPRPPPASKGLSGDTKAAYRTSVYTEEDRLSGLGLALTTDAPTRYIKPDNHRTSIVSASSGSFTSAMNSQATYSDGGRNRDTLYSSYVPSIHEDDEYDPTKEDGDATSVIDPLPPPSHPIPTLPTSPRRRPHPLRTSTSASSMYIAEDSPQPLPTPPIPAPWAQSPPPPKVAHSRSWLHRKPSKSRSLHTAPLPKTSIAPSAAGPTKTVACVYMVAGLAKDPASWTLSDHADSGAQPPAHLANAVPRFWRPEVLGCSVTGEHGTNADEFTSLEGDRAKRKSSYKKQQQLFPQDDLVTLSKEEVSRIQGKAMKLAFNRDVEILATTVQPPSTLSTFTFRIPTTRPLASAPGVSGSTAAAWDSSIDPIATAEPVTETPFYASCLLVWSHADPSRSEAIQATLHAGAKAKSHAINNAVRAASAGKKLGSKLARQLASPLGAVISEGREWGPRGAMSDTDGETDAGMVTESEWGDAAAVVQPLAPLPSSTPFWLPFALILVSQTPLHNLLSDALRISWARYHQDIAQHSLHMRTILSTPLPRPGEKIVVPVSASVAQASTHFVARMPGVIDWTTGAAQDANFLFWPLFRALDADNLLTIAEVALSPLGRVLFISAYPVMLGLATNSFHFILEQRGWRGLVHQTAHCRDLRIFVEDPGPWLIAIPAQSRLIALSDLPPEILVVDLDSNSVRVQNPHPGAISTGSARDKARKRLADAIGSNAPYYSIPAELHEAFPGGRFRPFSEVEVDGVPKEAERLRPTASWDWDQERVLREFDAILKEAPRTTLIAKVFRTKNTRRIPELAPSAKHVQGIVRKHAATFIDRRDLLESRITRLNNKLALLIAESAEWQRSLEVFQTFSDKLTRESVELKTRLEKERREARRLTGQVSLERTRMEKLEESLVATDTAREQALQQLAEVQAVRTALEQQKNLLKSEIEAVLHADESSPLFEAAYSRIDAISHRSETGSRPGTSHSMRSSIRTFRLAVAEDEDEGPGVDNERVTENTGEVDEAEVVRLLEMKTAVQEAFASIQSRLAIVLQNAETLEPPPSAFSQNSDRASHQSQHGLDTPPPSATPSPNLPQGPADDEKTEVVKPDREPRRFTPKPFQLASPPVSPDMNNEATPHSFVTARTSIDSGPRRQSSRPPIGIRHRPNASVVSYVSEDVDMETPTAATPSADATFSGRTKSPELLKRGSANSFGVPVAHQVDDRDFGNSPESRQSDYDDAESFVSFDDAGSARLGSTGSSFSSHGSADVTSEFPAVTQSFGYSQFESTAGRRPSVSSSISAVPDSPIDASVDLFTRSVSKRNLMANALAVAAEQPSRLPRPVSSITVKQNGS